MNLHYIGTGVVLYDKNSQVLLEQKEYNIYRIISNNYQPSYNIYYENMILKKIRLQYRNESIARVRIRELYKLIREDICEKKKIITGIENYYYPHTVVFFLTNRCLHSCIHCFRESNCVGNEMGLSDALRIVDILKGKVANIIISGGEPLNYSEIAKFIEYCHVFFNIEIMSSLYLEKDINLSMLKKVKCIQATIYGSNSEQHDSFVNNKGSFKKVCKNIETLLANGIKVTLSSMNSREENLEDIIMLAIKLGVYELQFGEIEPVGRAVKNRDKITFYKVTKATIQKLQMKYKDKIEILYDEGCGTNKKDQICGAGLLKYDIDEYGNVYPCLFANKDPVGNILIDNDIFEKKLSLNLKECMIQPNCYALEKAQGILRRL